MTKVSIIDMIAKKLRRCIAIVEDGDTASQAIASGKFVIWKGNPCKASTAISAGATLSNSNLTALSDGIGNELNGKLSTESITLTNTQSVYSYSFIKKDNQRFLYMELLNWSITDVVVVGVIPLGDRPTIRRLVMVPATDANLANASGMVAVTVGTNGNIEVKSIGTGSSRFVAFSIAWNV